jgi:hypothetical protein
MKHSPIFLHSLVAISMAGSALGGNTDEPVVIPSTPPSDSPWEFRIEPYAWLTGLTGDISKGPLTLGIDQGFTDIVSDLKMAAALQMEARKGRWGIMADGFYANLGTSAETRSELYGEGSVGVKEYVGELAVAYRVYEGPNSFVDLYGGFRYNNLTLDLSAQLDVPGIDAASARASEHVVGNVEDIAAEIISPKIEEFKIASASRRAEIAAEVETAVKEQAGNLASKQLALRLKRIRSDGGMDPGDLKVSQIVRSVRAQRLEVARTTAALMKTTLRAAAGEVSQSKVADAQTKVDHAEEELAKAVSTHLKANLPTSASFDREWVDPIIGVRAQWNINDRWFLAGKSDVGGFGVGSDLAWTVQGTVGYQFTNSFSTEVGYRYFDTDYRDGDFEYDIAEHGLFVGFNFTF